jgi:hypothetical protein
MPAPGEWLFTTREGAEADLSDELFLAGSRDARIVAPSIVVAGRAPRHEGRLELTFARQAFQVSAVVTAGSPSELGAAAASSMARAS